MSHYNSEYFDWQKNVGAFGGQANQFKFKEFIAAQDRVIDFGCGGGFLLAKLSCADRIGIEINETARAEANRNGLKVFSSTQEVPDEWADVIISNNALEHTFSPYHELKALYSKLKKGGKLIIVVPHELKTQWHEDDAHQHLYTWSPLNIGNLVKTVGYQVKQVDTIKHLWPPNYIKWRQYLGQKGFDAVSLIYGTLFGEWQQIRVVAEKPKDN